MLKVGAAFESVNELASAGAVNLSETLPVGPAFLKPGASATSVASAGKPAGCAALAVLLFAVLVALLLFAAGSQLAATIAIAIRPLAASVLIEEINFISEPPWVCLLRTDA